MELENGLRTRIGVSPIHPDVRLGALRTFLFASSIVDKHRIEGKNATLVLKVDDTDGKKHNLNYFNRIRSILVDTFSIKPDIDPSNSLDKTGLNLIQSENNAQYTAVTNQLLERGFAYKVDDSDLVYFNYEAFEKYHGSVVSILDITRGVISSNFLELQPIDRQGRHSRRKHQNDFVLRRSDGSHIFDITSTVDDINLGINLVIRGCDKIGCSLRQAMVTKALGMPTPNYLHLPLLVSDKGTRLKTFNGGRETFVTRIITEYCILPTAIHDYLISSCGPNPEVTSFSQDEISTRLDISRISRHNTKFDIKKLLWTNSIVMTHLNAKERLAQLEKVFTVGNEFNPKLHNLDIKDLILSNLHRKDLLNWSTEALKELTCPIAIRDETNEDHYQICSIARIIVKFLDSKDLPNNPFLFVIGNETTKEGRIRLGNIIKWLFIGKTSSICQPDDILRFFFKHKDEAMSRLNPFLVK